MSKLTIDCCTEDQSADGFMELLNVLCTKFSCSITGLIPVGPGGGWPELEFSGDREDLIKLFIEYDGDNNNDPYIDGEFVQIHKKSIKVN